MKKSTKLGISLVALLACLGLTSMAMSSDVASARTDSAAVSEYLNDLNMAALDQPSFGYYELVTHKSARLGFVGPVPSEIRDLLAKAPAGAHVAVSRSVYTNSRMIAQAHKILHSSYSIIDVGRLPKGRGLVVHSQSRKLLQSRAPMKLLGVNVGLIVRRLP